MACCPLSQRASLPPSASPCCLLLSRMVFRLSSQKNLLIEILTADISVNKALFKLTGKANVGYMVTLTQNSNVLATTAIADSDRVWSIDVALSTNNNGANTFTATASNSAGNTATSTAVTITLDITVPIITLTGANPQTIELGLCHLYHSVLKLNSDSGWLGLICCAK